MCLHMLVKNKLYNTQLVINQSRFPANVPEAIGVPSAGYVILPQSLLSVFTVYLLSWRVSILAFYSLLTFGARKHFLQFTYFRGA